MRGKNSIYTYVLLNEQIFIQIIRYIFFNLEFIYFLIDSIYFEVDFEVFCLSLQDFFHVFTFGLVSFFLF